MASVKQKRAAIAKVFGSIPVDNENLSWLYARRHLTTCRDGTWRDLAYIVEADELEASIRRVLDRIRKRDGSRIAREVAVGLADSIAVSIGVER
jgi:hypothetical protein